MTGVAVLGVTGSIGKSTLDVVRSLSDGFTIVGMSAGSQWRAMAEAVKEFRPKAVGLADARAAEEFAASGALNGAQLFAGADASVKIASRPDADVVVSAIVEQRGWSQRSRPCARASAWPSPTRNLW